MLNSLAGSAQFTLEYYNPKVSENDTIRNAAFAGGINSAQFQSIDLDEDGDLDLVLFDRASYHLTTFENTGSAYVFQPEFEFSFPEQLKHWMVLADYDCDGRKDLFTYTGLGIRLFKNNLVNGKIDWELIHDPIETLGSISKINIFFNATDIPAIVDQDGDGDLDIIIFDFTSRERLEYHKNFAVENTGSCGIDYVRQTKTYGDIRDCNCDDFTIGEPCNLGGGRVAHIGGKALLAMDFDQNGVMDIILGQENCHNLNYSFNLGTADNANYQDFENDFPSMSTSLNFVHFPAAFLEDVTFDGHPDLLVSSNARTNPSGLIDMSRSSFVYPNSSTSENSFVTSEPFLQKDMIDVGSSATPAIVDINIDGKSDLILGNHGALIDGNLVSTLHYYQSTVSGLVLADTDLFGLSTFGLNYIKPQFIDLNKDGQTDLFFSATTATGKGGLYYLLNTGEDEFSFDLSDLVRLDFLFFDLDDYRLVDIDLDGNLDMLLGLSSGRLDYFRNSSTTLPPTFEIDTKGYLGIEATSQRSNLSLTVGDLDEDGKADLLTTDRSGILTVYSDFLSGISTPLENLVSLHQYDNFQVTRLGQSSKPAIGNLMGRMVVAIGTVQGGIHLLATGRAEEATDLKILAYPNPKIIGEPMQIISNFPDTQLTFFTLTGSQIGTEIIINANEPMAFDFLNFNPGLYIVKAKHEGQEVTIKIIIN